MNQPLSFQRDRFTWQLYLLTAYFAYFVNVLGPLTPFLRRDLQLTYTQASFHFSAYALGLILISSTAERIISRLGVKPSLWVGAAGQSLGALLLATGLHPAVTVLGCGLIGAFGALLLSLIPSLLSERFGEQRGVAIAETNAGGSISGLLAPAAVGLLARNFLGWRGALYLIVAAFLVLFLVFRREPGLQNPRRDLARSASAPGERLPLAYWLFWVMLVLVDAIEFCMIYWGADYLIAMSGLITADAALALSAFLVSMLAGRLALSRLLRKFSARQLLPVSLLITLAGFALFWFLPLPLTAVGGLLISGLGVANLYPLTISLALGITPGQTELAAARASLASGLGILALPLLLGNLADRFGIWWAFAVVPLLVLISLGLLASARTAARPAPAASRSFD